MPFMSSEALNKQGLLDLVARAERGVLLPGEAQILREAVELLDDMAMTLETISRGEDVSMELKYDPSDTQSFAVIEPPVDDDAPGRP